MFDVKSKILLVDDMMTIRKIAKKILGEMDYKNLHEASDGDDAWKMITEQGDFDLVICDWNMPRMSGLQLLKMVRSSEKFKDLTFLLLTAEANMSQVKTAMDAGVDNYILKPFSSEHLKSKLEQTYTKINSRRSAA